MDDFAVGSTLNNGATVLQAKQPQDDIVVLGFINGEFVTWKVNGERMAFWGHYFDQNLAAALKDYEART